MAGELEIRDLRTGEVTNVTIQPGNYVNAADLSRVGLPKSAAKAKASGGLRILDRGFEHTACMQSNITYM